MKPTLSRELALDALLMAVLRRRLKSSVIVHSDQGSHYGSGDWIRFCREHGLVLNMSRRGNCYDNAVAESFFSSLKKERVRHRIYRTREEAKTDLFDYIEIFYNRTRRHSHLGQVSSYDFEMASLRKSDCLQNQVKPIFLGYNFSDNFWAALGANIFGGKEDTTQFGSLDRHDNLYMQARYKF